MEQLQQILDQALQQFAAISDEAELEQVKAKYLGKEGSLTVLLKGLGKLSAEERPAAGARINQLFHSLGFATASGPEIEHDFYNFTALNIPENHPARAMHDTFYIDPQHVLQTHTSPVQIRCMEAHQPPLKIIATH